MKWAKATRKSKSKSTKGRSVMLCPFVDFWGGDKIVRIYDMSEKLGIIELSDSNLKFSDYGTVYNFYNPFQKFNTITQRGSPLLRKSFELDV